MDAKVTHTFTVGSTAFFRDMPGFVTKDIDIVCLLDLPLFGDSVMNMRRDGKDIFFIHNSGKRSMIESCLNGDTPMAAGKFLVPEFAEHIGMTTEDLKILKPMFDRMDERHLYEQKIFSSYIENGSFTLTDEQRREAYDVYLKAKK